jgi:predicted DNA binding CopG/RHH family protein
MNKKTTYTNGPIGDTKVVRDFLPAPGELVFKEEQVKVTIGLSKGSVDFFKEAARRHHTQYQKMIRRLLDLYVAQHQ